MDISPDQDYVLKLVKERGIQFIRFWFPDVLGNLKNFAVAPTEIPGAFSEGMGFDGSSIEGFSRVEESDMIAIPDASTFQILPWRPKDFGVARMFCNIYNPDGSRFEGDPRYALERVVRKAADMGYTPNFGPELEYFYFKDSQRTEPLDQGGYFDLTPHDSATDLRRDTVLTLEKMGIPVEYSHHEAAPSQHEIDLRFSDAMSMADAVMTYRLVVKEVAFSHGVYATFMPKPIQSVSGNSMHVHQSLFDEEGRNVFFSGGSPDGYNLSAIARHYIAGLLKYAPEFSLITNQYVNSYKRLTDGEAPRFITWANRNRSAMARVPMYKPGKEGATRVEMRSADPTGNPYLVFAVMLASGLRGVEEKLELPAPSDGVNLLTLSEDELASLGVGTLPTNLGDAIVSFEQSSFMKEILGEHIHRYYVRSKREEWKQYCSYVSQWELDNYLPNL